MNITNEARFYQLIAGALAQEFSGWDFAFMKDRSHYEALTWDYPAIVREHMPNAKAMLDMGTGGGEFLSTLAPFPPLTAATEGWDVNYPIAQKRLEPLGIQVHHYTDDANLPFADETFNLVINRHESYDAKEIYRIMKPGGRFITQQVGRYNDVDINEVVTGIRPDEGVWSVADGAADFANAGFKIVRTEEAFPITTYYDIAAIVFYLTVIKWAIDDFAVHKYITHLAGLHNQMEQGEPVKVKAHRYFIEAQKSI